ncbi:hypothetical protein ATKI12_0005 [Kitasatospora sp. Ki12]
MTTAAGPAGPGGGEGWAMSRGRRRSPRRGRAAGPPGPRRASVLAAESGQASGSEEPSRSAAGSTAVASGACSMMTWAFAGDAEGETPARRGRPVSGHCRAA